MNTVVRNLLLSLMVVVGAAAAWGQSAAAPRGIVTGLVKNAAGPLVGIKVEIKGANAAYSNKAVTDNKGSFSFSDAPLGNVVVTAFDSRGRTIASVTGKVQSQGEVVTLALTTP